MPCNLHSFGILFFLLSLLHYVTHSTPAPDQELHIVYLGRKNNSKTMNDHTKHQLQLLSDVFSSEEDAKQSMVHSYKHTLSGFSAMLNPTQVAALAKRKEVISVFKSKMLKLHTTRSWDFMGLTGFSSSDDGHQPPPPIVTPLQLAYGDDIIVGVIDSGIWPESGSFEEEEGMKEVGSSWKGKCVEGEMFEPQKACNRKLIGARFYVEGFEKSYGAVSEEEYRSPRDFLGHGTHTASTAVGSAVAPDSAAFMGLAGKGTARGGAPRARLAVYKACWATKEYAGLCSDADILAAFDDALNDGVHVISASIGSTPPLPQPFSSSNSIGSFHAVQRGVPVVFSAGNDGPDPGLVTNVDPWAFTVAASTLDRTFQTRVVVEGNFSVQGESLISNPIAGKLVDPITYFTNGACKSENRKNSRMATGRVVLCFSTVGAVDVGQAQSAAFEVNASALIFAGPAARLLGPDVFPTLYLDISEGTKLKHYLARFLRLPKMQIEASKTVIGHSVAPKVAFFSSRGPSSVSPEILKPDITAPGVNILAAWPTETAATVEPPYEKGMFGKVSWNIVSGTSMACPHVSGVVALLKSAHPRWSPAVIKSALMTTAEYYNNPLETGAGHMNPVKAMDPGLVYDIQAWEYSTSTSTKDLNYPSISVSVSISNPTPTVTVKRTLRNVGASRVAVYFLRSVSEPPGVKVVVWPRVLLFSWFREEITYYVSLSLLNSNSPPTEAYAFGHLLWSDATHHVTTTLLVCLSL